MQENVFSDKSIKLQRGNSKAIKVIGIGDGGIRAINCFLEQDKTIPDIDFYSINTDTKGFRESSIPNKIQIGVNLVEGSGAGANPDIGEQSALENSEDIAKIFDSNTKVVFIITAMGGGTGTGATPYIASLTKRIGVLTIGIVSTPFKFEGKQRVKQSQKGINKLDSLVDSLIIINNNRLREVYGNLGFTAGFSKANEVLCITLNTIFEVLFGGDTKNFELRDTKKIFGSGGRTIIGMSSASGKNRAKVATSNALNSPLLDDNSIYGARNVLLHIIYGTDDLSIDEIGEINDMVLKASGEHSKIIMQITEDKHLEEGIAINLIANDFIEGESEYKTNLPPNELESEIERNQNLARMLIENKERNQFFKKEVLLITPMLLLVLIYLFVLNNYNNVIAFTSTIITTGLVSLKLYYTFLQRQKKYGELIKKVLRLYKNYKAENQKTLVEEEPEKQIQLTFDLPLSEKKEDVDSDYFVTAATMDVEDISVDDYIEFISFNENNEEVEWRYVLDDSIDDQSVEDLVEEANLVFEKKVVSILDFDEENTDDNNPLNKPISQLLKERSGERRLKMKDFNYKFNKAKFDDFEKIPKYKRQEVEFGDTKNEDEEEEIKLKGKEKKKK